MVLPAAALLVALLDHPSTGVLTQLFWFFTKAGAFMFGSGLAIVPFLYGGIVEQYPLAQRSAVLRVQVSQRLIQ